MKWGRIFSLVVFLFPLPALAQVVFDEVMYNPHGSDTAREWIELYNGGSNTVSLVGGSGKGSWRVNDGSNHTIIDPAGGTGRGTLSIPAGGYLVIASDPTEFISGEYSGGTYSVAKSSIALNNSGATLTLLDGTGSTVDTVAYVPSQGGSDDGSSLQRQSDGSWIAALPTPGIANSATAYVAPVSTDVNATQSNAQQNASSTDQTTGQSQTPEVTDSYVAPPVPSLYADAGTDRTVIVGADVEFDASAYDKTQALLDPTLVRFIWNFGDGGTAEGGSVLHHFSYPGRYAVTLDIANNRNAAEAQIAVAAQPAALAFSLLPDGGVGIENFSSHNLDLSEWIVRQDGGPLAAQFILPESSKVLASSAMRISPQTLNFRGSSSTVLEYPNGEAALVVGASAASSTDEAAQRTVAPTSAADVASAKPGPAQPPEASEDPASVPEQSASADEDDADSAGAVSVAPDPTSTVLQSASAASAPLSKYLWWSGVGALALAVAAALVAASQFKRGEWDIVEDTSE